MPSKKTFLPFLILTIGLMLCLQINQSISAQKLELVVQTGHSSEVSSISFINEGKHLISIGETIKLWDTNSGKEIKTLVIKESPWGKFAVSSDMKIMAKAESLGAIQIIDAESGLTIKTLDLGTQLIVNSIALSSDGKMIAISGEKLQNNEFINIGQIWSLVTLTKIEDFSNINGESSDSINCFEFSPQGEFLAVITIENKIEIHEIKEFSKIVKTINVRAKFPLTKVLFSPNEKFLVGIDLSSVIKLWDIQTGKMIKTFSGHSDDVISIAFSKDGKLLASGSKDKSIKLWNVETGEMIKTFSGHNGQINSIAFSLDGLSIASGSGDKTIKLWNIEDGKEIRTFQTYSKFISSLIINNDKKIIAFTNFTKKVMLWNLETGQINNLSVEHKEIVGAIAFSSDGKILASGSFDKTIKLWDVKTGNEIRTLIGHSKEIDRVAFSVDDNILVSKSRDGTFKFWETKTGDLIKTLDVSKSSSASEVDKIFAEAQNIAPNLRNSSKIIELGNNILVSPVEGSKIQFFDWNKRKEILNLIPINENDWVIIDSEGRFDASDGALKLMHYAYGLQTVDLEQFKDEYFEPGLLQKIFKGERLRAVVPLKDAKLPPEIVSQVFDVKTNKLVVKLKNRGGGFGAVKVFVNDKLAVADARDAKLKANPTTAQEFVELAVDLKNGAFVNGKICETKDGKEECRDNKITVYTSNYLADFKKSNITSRGTSVFTIGGGDETFKLPTLYAIVGGVSDYAGNDLDLKFAAKDAEDFSNALGLGARQLFCAKETPNCLDKVQITTLSTSGKAGTIQPTKENFRKAFAEIAQKAEPTDIVLVYLSGHGVSLDDTDTYFYLTADAASTSKEDLTKNYAKISITSNELLCWMTTTPCDADKTLTFEGKPQIGNKALRQVIILDTCAAGKAGQTLALIAQKDLSTDQRRAIEFLKDKTGTHILMGSTADQPSYEASKFGQGLLTRALLEGMSGAALEKVNGFVDIQTLFRYAENRVEKLAVGIGGIQRPTNAAPTGKTFVIGQMMQNSQKQIAEILPREKPYILRPSFGNREDNYDILGINNQLAKILNDQNNPLMQKGGEAVLVYLNEENFTGAIKPTGFYTITGETVTVKVSLYRDDIKVGETFEVIANKNEIAEKLLAAIREKL